MIRYDSVVPTLHRPTWISCSFGCTRSIPLVWSMSAWQNGPVSLSRTPPLQSKNAPWMSLLVSNLGNWWPNRPIAHRLLGYTSEANEMPDV